MPRWYVELENEKGPQPHWIAQPDVKVPVYEVRTASQSLVEVETELDRMLGAERKRTVTVVLLGE